MTRIRATCPSCGEVELRPGGRRPPPRHRRRSGRSRSGSCYRFSCPDCTELVEKPADERIVSLLTTGGVAVEDVGPAVRRPAPSPGARRRWAAVDPRRPARPAPRAPGPCTGSTASWPPRGADATDDDAPRPTLRGVDHVHRPSEVRPAAARLVQSRRRRARHGGGARVDVRALVARMRRLGADLDRLQRELTPALQQLQADAAVTSTELAALGDQLEERSVARVTAQATPLEAGPGAPTGGRLTRGGGCAAHTRRQGSPNGWHRHARARHHPGHPAAALRRSEAAGPGPLDRPVHDRVPQGDARGPDAEAAEDRDADRETRRETRERRPGALTHRRGAAPWRRSGRDVAARAPLRAADPPVPRRAGARASAPSSGYMVFPYVLDILLDPFCARRRCSTPRAVTATSSPSDRSSRSRSG